MRPTGLNVPLTLSYVKSRYSCLALHRRF